jgi:hypothetical protein
MGLILVHVYVLPPVVLAHSNRLLERICQHWRQGLHVQRKRHYFHHQLVRNLCRQLGRIQLGQGFEERRLVAGRWCLACESSLAQQRKSSLSEWKTDRSLLLCRYRSSTPSCRPLLCRPLVPVERTAPDPPVESDSTSMVAPPRSRLEPWSPLLPSPSGSLASSRAIERFDMPTLLSFCIGSILRFVSLDPDHIAVSPSFALHLFGYLSISPSGYCLGRRTRSNDSSRRKTDVRLFSFLSSSFTHSDQLAWSNTISFCFRLEADAFHLSEHDSHV